MATLGAEDIWIDSIRTKSKCRGRLARGGFYLFFIFYLFSRLMIRPEKFREYISDLQRLTKKTKRLRLSVPQDLSFFGVFFFTLPFFISLHTIYSPLYSVLRNQ